MVVVIVVVVVVLVHPSCCRWRKMELGSKRLPPAQNMPVVLQLALEADALFALYAIYAQRLGLLC